MFKQILQLGLGLALAAGGLGATQAAQLSNGQVMLFNFSAPGSTAGVNEVTIGPWSMTEPTDDITVEFFDGLNLTGTSLGSFSILGAGAWNTLSSLLDGVFSVRLTAKGTPLIGWADLGLETRWVALVADENEFTGFRSDIIQTVRGTTATDDSQSTTTPPSNNVPEPGSLLLASLAGLALTVTRRRKPLAT